MSFLQRVNFELIYCICDGGRTETEPGYEMSEWKYGINQAPQALRSLNFQRAARTAIQ